MKVACFVTGTDTGIGKTHASAALLHALARHHRRVVGMKPIASGLVEVAGAWVSEDALILRKASTLQVLGDLDNPIALPEPLSPHLAAQRAGRRIDIPFLKARFEALAAKADAVVVEGAGGWIVPLNDQDTMADLAAALGLPVVLVVGLKLGCLNHAMLSAAAIRARGLNLVGWMANRIDPTMSCQEENLIWLRENLGAPLMADLPWQQVADPSQTQVALPPAWCGP